MYHKDINKYCFGVAFLVKELVFHKKLIMKLTLHLINIIIKNTKIGNQIITAKWCIWLCIIVNCFY